MLKLTVAFVAVAVAGAASALGWRSVRVDATSEAAFAESVALLEEKLSPSRRYAFALALQDIRLQVTREASAEGRTDTATEFLRQVDGLSYEEVVRVADSTGKAENRYRAQYYAGQRLKNGIPGQPMDRPLGFFPRDRPREAGESSFRPLGGEPGVNPWQR
jgi:uncharacterized membrane protein